MGTVLIHVHKFVNLDFRRIAWVRALDFLCLLPYWSFFAPNPGVYSYRLLVREYYDNRLCSHWREVPVAPPRQRLVQFLWNPHGCARKALLDICNELIESGNDLSELTESKNADGIKLTIPYIKLLALANSADRFPGSIAVQFVVIQSYKEETPKVLLLSGRHSV